MWHSVGHGRGLLPAILLVLVGCAMGPGAQEPTPPGAVTAAPPTAAPTTEPTAEPMPTAEPDAPAATATPRSQNPDDYYDPGGGVASPTPAVEPTDSAGGEATVTLGHSASHEAYLAGPDGLALYIFTQDSDGTSNCTDACAQAWPPLTVAMGESPVAGPGVTGALATIVRDDGTYQVTYDDAPLYYFASDTQPGDTTGHEVGGVWYLAQP